MRHQQLSSKIRCKYLKVDNLILAFFISTYEFFFFVVTWKEMNQYYFLLLPTFKQLHTFA
jgi:hypothetical protein